MVTWILILTLSNAGTIYEGKAIHSVEFESEEACQYAGKKWKGALDRDDKQQATFVCAPKRL